MDFIIYYLLLGAIYQSILWLTQIKRIEWLKQNLDKEEFKKYLTFLIKVSLVNGLLFPVDILLKILCKISPKVKDECDESNRRLFEDWF